MSLVLGQTLKCNELNCTCAYRCICTPPTCIYMYITKVYSTWYTRKHEEVTIIPSRMLHYTMQDTCYSQLTMVCMSNNAGAVPCGGTPDTETLIVRTSDSDIIYMYIQHTTHSRTYNVSASLYIHILFYSNSRYTAHTVSTG